MISKQIKTKNKTKNDLSQVVKSYWGFHQY